MLSVPNLTWAVLWDDPNQSGNTISFPDPSTGVLSIVITASEVTTFVVQVATENGCVIGQQEFTAILGVQP
jgi:hypothetical protein